MIGHVEMNDTTTVVAEHHKDEQNAKRCGWHGEEVDGDQVAQVVVEKAPPGLGRWFSMAHHVLGDRGLGNGYAKLHQLAMHSGGTPKRIGSAHAPDQLANFGSDTRST